VADRKDSRVEREAGTDISQIVRGEMGVEEAGESRADASISIELSVFRWILADCPLSYPRHLPS
jgi:hypothetical protein